MDGQVSRIVFQIRDFPALRSAFSGNGPLSRRSARCGLNCEKLWICPLCQRRSQIRRIIDREVFRVGCGDAVFRNESDLLEQFRLA